MKLLEIKKIELEGEPYSSIALDALALQEYIELKQRHPNCNIVYDLDDIVHFEDTVFIPFWDIQ